MIDATLSWFMKWISQSQLREADRLEAQAEIMKQRAIKLRHEASLYFRASGQPPQTPLGG